MLQEFKAFLMRGNVMDLTVGVIIGAAFGKIVDSLVNDILMPIIGLILGKIDFANLFLVLSEGKAPGPYHSLDVARKSGAAVLAYGNFINTVVYFVIIGFVVFMLIRFVTRLVPKKEAAPAPAGPPEDIVLLREIRDSLRTR